MITITGRGENAAAILEDERDTGVILQNFAPFIDYISETNNTQIDNAKDLDVKLKWKLMIMLQKWPR